MTIDVIKTQLMSAVTHLAEETDSEELRAWAVEVMELAGRLAGCLEPVITEEEGTPWELPRTEEVIWTPQVPQPLPNVYPWYGGEYPIVTCGTKGTTHASAEATNYKEAGALFSVPQPGEIMTDDAGRPCGVYLGQGQVQTAYADAFLSIGSPSKVMSVEDVKALYDPMEYESLAAAKDAEVRQYLLSMSNKQLLGEISEFAGSAMESTVNEVQRCIENASKQLAEQYEEGDIVTIDYGSEFPNDFLSFSISLEKSAS